MKKGPAPTFDKEVGKADKYPAAKSNSTGSRGGMPGFSNTNNGGTKTAAGNLHMTAPGSGHVPAHTKRAVTTGYSKG